VILLYLSSGLFLGWSLGANDAANVFGTAVGTRMIKFKLAAIIAALALILGAVLEGAGASHTLGELGAVNKLAGAFTVALAAAFTVTVMTRMKLPVSTSQAIVGAIIGWNLFSGSPTDMNSLTKIVTTWVLCPILAALFAIILYKLIKKILESVQIHLLTMDAYTRIGLIVAGALGAYSLGANNIANVMGVFIPASPFDDIMLLGNIRFSGTQQLFLIGALAIGVGIFTYSARVMKTVGKDIFRLSPVTAFVVVISHSLVLYIFASQGLRDWFVALGLPPIPLVPVSSSQAIVGAILGIAFAKGARNINWKVMGKIASGWVTTPITAGIISFIALFFVQNVFDLDVYREKSYLFSPLVMERLADANIEEHKLELLSEMEFDNQRQLRRYSRNLGFDEQIIDTFAFYSARNPMKIRRSVLASLDLDDFSRAQKEALAEIITEEYEYEWQLYYALSQKSDQWAYKSSEHDDYNQKLDNQYQLLFDAFRID
jgi:PiT family inorganic phosphate transporter